MAFLPLCRCEASEAIQLATTTANTKTKYKTMLNSTTFLSYQRVIKRDRVHFTQCTVHEMETEKPSNHSKFAVKRVKVTKTVCRQMWRCAHMHTKGLIKNVKFVSISLLNNWTKNNWSEWCHYLLCKTILYYVRCACLPLLLTKVVDYILCALSITHNPSYAIFYMDEQRAQL